MKVTILNQDPNGHWLSVHKAGCRDLSRLPHFVETDWHEDHDTITEIALSICSDFINEGSMTEDESLQHVHFYPCVTLPLT